MQFPEHIGIAALILPEGAARLVEVSGGVLRDLIGLARDAGEEAYLAGVETIGAAHADAAADAFGRTLMLGLAADDLAAHQRSTSTRVEPPPSAGLEVAILLSAAQDLV